MFVSKTINRSPDSQASEIAGSNDLLNEKELFESPIVTDDEASLDASEGGSDDSDTDDEGDRVQTPSHPDLPEEVWDRERQSDAFRHPVDFGVPQPEKSEIPEDSFAI